nr:unnamed protein product [Digitaria exilis]
MASSSSQQPHVCVTGAGGFIASWLVKLLLSRGYTVHGTVRDPCNPKNGHLRLLDGAPERLLLFKADVLDRDALAAAIAGCQAVFHVASPDWYSAAKTTAEETALEYGEKNGLMVVTVCPCIVVGPLLQPVINTTSELLIYITKGLPSYISASFN